jgi:hypothetical protein
MAEVWLKIEAADCGPRQGLTRRLVMFDLDGTLIDSTPGIWASVRAAAAVLSLPEPTREQLRGMIGPPLQDGFALVLGVPPDDVPRAVAAYRAHHSAGALLDATVYPGVPELLAALADAGATLAVATSKPEPFAVRLLAHAGLLPSFASVHGATFDGTAPCGTRTRWSPPRSRRTRTASGRCWSATGRTTCRRGRARAALHRRRLGSRAARRTRGRRCGRGRRNARRGAGGAPPRVTHGPRCCRCSS